MAGNSMPINKIKKSNRRCCNCNRYSGGNYAVAKPAPTQEQGVCLHTGEPKNYWNCCKHFAWREDKNYTE